MHRDSGLVPPTPTQVLLRKRNALVRCANWKRLLVSLVLTAIFTLVLFGLVFGVGLVSGSSMNPLFQNKDIVLYTRAGNFSRYDVVILQADGTLIHKYVKRVIGVPGDVVNIDENGISINGEFLEESYTAGLTQANGAGQYPMTLEEGEYFVLGDNRESSRDSRNFGAIKDNQIEGKVIAVLRIDSKNGRR